jgi:hypothetical protein
MARSSKESRPATSRGVSASMMKAAAGLMAGTVFTALSSGVRFNAPQNNGLQKKGEALPAGGRVLLR